jgi:XTP/dITP diphosphohydrolase
VRDARPVVIATRNPGKVRELRAMFASIGLAVQDLSEAGLAKDSAAEDALEVHDTFEGNARAKARWFAAKLPGRIVVADDSGLEVAALGGAPGVRSKRWSGSHESGAALEAANNAALMRALDGARDRSARFVSVVVALGDGAERLARGECTGRILDAAEGTNGFGYDACFHCTELGKSFGVASAEEKARVSHRARAFALLTREWARGGNRDAMGG